MLRNRINFYFIYLIRSPENFFNYGIQIDNIEIKLEDFLRYYFCYFASILHGTINLSSAHDSPHY